ncbi:MAG: tautomerase family protein [Planctomycetes bacterium]|nr:tautomerase family protein [Planctomycetota bacterium]
MPVVKISVRKGRGESGKRALLDAVAAALIEAIKVPDGHRISRVAEFEADDFQIPDSSADNFTLVEITLFPGRTAEAKRSLYQRIVANFEKLGIAPADVHIILYEPPLENWGMRGGIPASELDFGYKVDV